MTCGVILTARSEMKGVIFLLIIMFLTVSGAWAKPTTPEQARAVVENWLALDAAPLGSPLGQHITEAKPTTPEQARVDVLDLKAWSSDTLTGPQIK